MQALRLGIRNFLGIFIPGSYVAGILFLAIISIIKTYWNVDLTKSCNIVSENIAFFSLIFLFIPYLLGVLVRLFAPRTVDRLSKWYFYNIRRKKGVMYTDMFPYKASISKRLRGHGMKKVVDFINALNRKWGIENNTTFFNYCKCFVDANSPALFKQIKQYEAFIRFLSGTTLALMLAILVSIIMAIFSLVMKMPILYLIYFGLLIISVLCLFLILVSFKHQRRREVFLVWFSVYIILNGGLLENDSRSTSMIVNSVFF